MPLRDFKCSDCGWEEERFYWATRDESPSCSKCDGHLEQMALSATKNDNRRPVFPFVTPHISGKPIEVQSLSHARRLERQYGVVLSAFSQDPCRQTDGIRDLPTFRGETPYSE